MASIEPLEGKNGTTYRITVCSGYDSAGKKIRHRMVYKPEPGKTARQTEKAVTRAAADFERDIELGYQLDNRQTFEEYAAYVLDLKKRSGIKLRTYERYLELMERINAGIGHIKLADLRPQHLDAFYKNLGEAGIRLHADRAVSKTDLRALLKSRKLSMEKVASEAGISASTVSIACRGEAINSDKADAIAKALDQKMPELFTIKKNTEPLSNKTILEYHRLIRAVLAYAEKQMLVPYNAAAKATPPKVSHKEVNYFQPDEIIAILDALEQEPIKWRTITHLMIVTGCRRGEIMGLHWDAVDWANNQIRIDRALLYSSKKGIYEDTTKTSETRFIKLPVETMALLRDYRQWHIELRFKNGDRWQDTGYMFTRDDGRPCEPDTITAWLSDFSKRHGLPHINPHAFRHTVASVLIANGTDVVTVSKQLGHANVATTESFYSHIIEENKTQATECIANVMLRRRA